MKDLKKLLKDNRGVFGLTAVQQFFAIILAIALLAYIIVLILGVLGGTTILSSTSATVTNETGAFINNTGYSFATSTTSGFANPTIIVIVNDTSGGGETIHPDNWTLTGSTLTNATAVSWNRVNITYSYNLYTQDQKNLDSILGNTSTGVSGFFSNISPVYAILAVLVIILVLVILVRVVSPGNSRQAETPL